MPLNVINGQYRILHSEPDGDSVHFYPADPAAFRTLHLPAHVNHGGGVQLRLDAIDALETHYTPRVRGGFLQHQPLELAHAAAAALLDMLGFTGVRRDGETVTAATPAQTDGHLLTRFADKYGRPVCLAYPGGDHADLSPVYDAGLLEGSVNYQLLTRGLVYPTYYSQLYAELRRHLTDTVERARQDKAGVWATDATTAGATIGSLADLTDQIVILPKLFRRLVDYFALGGGSVSLNGFTEFLATRDDRLFVISEQRATGLDNVLTVDGQTVRLDYPPEDLIFLET